MDESTAPSPIPSASLGGFQIRRSFLIALLGALTVWSQSTSRISGTVTDSSGAVVAGAKVTLIDEGTKAQLAQTTQANGTYVFPTLTQGTYTVTVVQPGFAEGKTMSVVLDVSSTRVVDFALQLGSASEVVEVHATEQQVDAQSAVVATTINSRDVDQIQLNGRYFQNLAVTLPGSTATAAAPLTEFPQLTISLRWMGPTIRTSAGLSIPFRWTRPLTPSKKSASRPTAICPNWVDAKASDLLIWMKSG